MMIPSLLPALFALVALAEEATSISVPTGKETPITPAKVTPRPTYRPPTSNPAPVVEYSLDNPEPEPLDPSWAYVPVKYLNVLSGNSIRYVPMTIRNPYPYLYKDNADVNQAYDYAYGSKVTKGKYKPRYYHPKFAQAYKVPTKGGYPKKATSDMKYYYYQKQEPQQLVQQVPQQILEVPQQQMQQVPQQQMQVPQQQMQVPQQPIQQVPQQQMQAPQQGFQQQQVQQEYQQQQYQQQQQLDQTQSQ